MTYVSSLAKVNCNRRKVLVKKKVHQYNKIDRTYTTFGGNGCLTKEQYEKGMALSQKMRNYSAW